MKRRRRALGNNLAFLDVMACGLGAAVLVFLIVKHHTGAEPMIEEAVSDDGQILTMLRQSEAMLEDQVEATARQIENLQTQNEDRENQIEAHKAKQAELEDLQLQIKELKTKNSGLKKEVVRIRPQQTADVIQNKQTGEEDYLIGLKVEGRRIAIVLDHSASMTDEKLVDIVTRKLGSDADKQKGPKWNRTVRVARWLLARLPKSSEVAVIGFNEKAKLLNKGAWAHSSDATQINGLLAEIVSLVPTGGTNLEAGLRELRNLRPQATDIYIVTDGLPTRSVSSPNPISRCRKNATKVSGKCRVVLFNTAIKHSIPARSKINVILLPVEGDPDAGPQFWGLTAATGGLLLVPAVGWP